MQLKWKLFPILFLIVVALVYVVPSVSPNLPAWWRSLGILPTEKIHLGLDLQGGMHLVLEVQTQKAVESRIERTAQELRDAMKKAGIRYADLDPAKEIEISLRILNVQSAEAFDDMLDKQFPRLRLVSKTSEGEDLVVRLDLPEQEVKYIKEMASKQAMETIRNRIDQFGVSEPDIRRQGENRILIQLPGIKDPQRAINLIGQTALLEFKLVDEDHDVQDALKGKIPPADDILYQITQDKVTRRETKTPFLVKKRTYLTGEYLTDARVQIDSQFGEPYVSVDFDKKGARLFERITEANVKKRLAIVLDGYWTGAFTQLRSFRRRSAGGVRVSRATSLLKTPGTWLLCLGLVPCLLRSRFLKSGLWDPPLAATRLRKGSFPCGSVASSWFFS
jgi:preprotein translocase subunit SecD